ncbi:MULTISPECIES: phosphonate C-P lyase system protein PhnH [Thalassospira]|uniref:Phosphonate metabolism protein PhnH n=2 Tax=Thalassospira TaxID=168934 RepID=A0A367W7C7_9PROT|nr:MULTISPECIES: phosphonate C-P lyase system protein PhnH [Thalassospira]MDG4720679.1 phosphonate C-P lyase system protein PhnH [Thalassospira sp. FZY0004]RCK37354.1 phosphonate metabolism protein PhnH [Thalassospira profundimaris]
MTLQSQTSELLPGFEHTAFDSNAVFRVLLDALSRPGRIYDLPVSVATPDGLNATTTATLLAMADMDTTIWLSPSCKTKAANDHLKFHCGCPISDDVVMADFAVARMDDDLSFVSRLSVGNAEYPDQSATLILMVDEISNAPAMKLTGPGIKDSHDLEIKNLPASFHVWRAENHHLFPCGVDVIFTSPTQIVALSRTTRIEVI